MTPPAAPTLRPKRVLSCDTCDYAEKSNARFYPFKCMISKPVPMMVHEYCVGWFSYVGCASHPSTPDADARQRIEDVIEFIKCHDDEICGSYGLWEMNSYECMSFNGNCTLCKVTKAIALLKDGVERK